MKYYAVRKGKESGIYESWEDCQQNTKGYRGAEYKAFSVMEEAEKYMAGENLDIIEFSEQSIKESKSLNDDEIIIYTDGSFNKDLNISSYGFVCLTNNSNEYTSSGLVKDKNGTQNVIGEITGVLEAIKYAMLLNKKKIYIYHDYEGLSKWCNGQWKIKNSESAKYVEQIKEYEKSIQIEFIKVKAHSGNKYNEICDKLAKNEIKSLEPSINDDWGFKSYKFSDNLIKKTLENIKNMCSDFTYKIDDKNNHIVVTCFLGKQKLTFQKYKLESGNKLLIPSKQSDTIFSLLITYLNDYNSVDAMILSLNANNNTNVSVDVIRNRLYSISPRLKNTKINVSIYKLLIQSTYNLFLEIQDVEDSSFLTTPVLRALEGQLKYVFKEKLNIEIKNSGFHYFDKINNNYFTLQTKYANNISVDEQKYINDCYNKYSMIRHKLLHFGDLDIPDTKLLNTDDSKKIIIETIELIGIYYE